MGIICESCGRDIDALGQDNMSCTSEPLCEDCWSERQSHAVAALKRENASACAAGTSRWTPWPKRRLRPRSASCATWPCRTCARTSSFVYATSRERALALTKLDECELWLTRCKTKRAAAQAAADAARPPPCRA